MKSLPNTLPSFKASAKLSKPYSSLNFWSTFCVAVPPIASLIGFQSFAMTLPSRDICLICVDTLLRALEGLLASADTLARFLVRLSKPPKSLSNPAPFNAPAKLVSSATLYLVCAPYLERFLSVELISLSLRGLSSDLMLFTNSF